MSTKLNVENVFILSEFVKRNKRLVTPSEDKEFYSWICKLKQDINKNKLSKEDYALIERVAPYMVIQGGIREVTRLLKTTKSKSILLREFFVFCRENNLRSSYNEERRHWGFYEILFLEAFVGSDCTRDILRKDRRVIEGGLYDLDYLRMGILHTLSYVPYKTAYILAERYGLFDGIIKDYKWLSAVLDISCLECFKIEISAVRNLGGYRSPANYICKEWYEKAFRSLNIKYDLRPRVLSQSEFVTRLKEYTFYDSILINGR